MGKPTQDGWKPDDPSVLNPPDPPEEHFTDDPLWKIKARRVTSFNRNRKGLLAFFVISGAIVLLVMALSR